MVKKIIGGIILILVIATLGVILYLRSFLPDYKGERLVQGLKDKVIVTRNPYGVPSIQAQNDEDLYFTWGYVNAQDRMFQMEITRRIGQGRLSEFSGESTLKTDFFLRATGFYEIAKQEVEKLSPEIRNHLQRYVDGVNYYLETQKTPFYFRLVGLKKEKWTLADPIVIGMMLNWSLAYNMKHELLYYQIARKIGKEKCKELFNFIPPDTPTILKGRLAQPLNEKMLKALREELGPLMGSQSASNNWVVGPQKSAYRGPILANDPHVHDSKIPSDFYLIHVKTKNVEVAGGQVVGLPFLAFGYNKHIAWGLTNNGVDHVDVFIESINEARKTYQFQGKEYPLAVKQETFYVKGKAPIQKTFYYVRGRPLLHEIFSELKEYVSMDWVGFGGMGVEGFFHINRARNYSEFLEGARMIKMTPQNMVYADTTGNIAYQVIGAIPHRQKGTGNFPQPGSGMKSNWDGILPAEMNPSLLNPVRGFIVTANNKALRGFPVDMNGTYAPRYRYERIEEMIQGKNKIDLEYIKKMQTDSQTALFRKVLPVIQRFVRPDNTEQSKKALETVVRWDGVVSPNSVGASIYNTFLVRFMFQTFADELGKDLAEEYVSQRYISLERFLSLIKEDSKFFDDISTPQKETIQEIASRAFRETLKILAQYTGSEDVEAWRWGKIHVIRFDHPLGKSKLLAPLVNQEPLPFQGDCETNNRAHFYEITPPFKTSLAAGLRLIVVFDPEPKGYLVLITGQNEYCLSDHYTDMIKLWMKGEYFSVEDAEVKYKMVLLPK